MVSINMKPFLVLYFICKSLFQIAWVSMPWKAFLMSQIWILERVWNRGNAIMPKIIIKCFGFFFFNFILAEKSFLFPHPYVYLLTIPISISKEIEYNTILLSNSSLLLQMFFLVVLAKTRSGVCQKSCVVHKHVRIHVCLLLFLMVRTLSRTGKHSNESAWYVASCQFG